MNSSEPLTQVAIESLRAIARNPARDHAAASTPAQRLALLNAILLRDQEVAAGRAAQRPALARHRTRL